MAGKASLQTNSITETKLKTLLEDAVELTLDRNLGASSTASASNTQSAAPARGPAQSVAILTQSQAQANSNQALGTRRHRRKEENTN